MRGATCLLCVAAWAMTGVPARTVRVPAAGGAKAASVEEVNVLMYGVLQFSETLHHVYQTTEAKLARIAKSMHHAEGAVTRLGRDTEHAKRAEGGIRDGLKLVQAQMAGLHAQAKRNRGMVTRVEQEEAELKEKLTNLEANLRSLAPDTIKALKEMTLKHSSALKDLLKWTMEQKLRLENQNQQLKTLQRQREP